MATAALQVISPQFGAKIMAAAILVSTFGCNNGLILAGARAYYAMARDGLFFGPIARLNEAKVPAAGLVVQGIWSALLVLPRTYDVSTGKYGNLYSNLLDYVISAALLFYVLTIIGIFRLRVDAARCRTAVPRVRISRHPGALRHRGVDHPAGALPLSSGDDVAGAGDRAAGRAGVLPGGARRAGTGTGFTGHREHEESSTARPVSPSLCLLPTPALLL